jgi:hypothetical protein
MDVSFAAFIPVVNAMIEIAEKFGLKRKYAHLCAIPLGLLISFLAIANVTVAQNIIFGFVIGIGAAGSCDTLGNCKAIAKPDG